MAGPLQARADRSPRVRRLAALQAKADARPVPAPMQLKDPRSRNPHNPHTGITSHHVIPHELLGTLLDKFKGQKGKDGAPDVPDEREAVLRDFLPAFDDLTLANFVAITSVKVTYDGRSPNKVTELPEDVATTRFADLATEHKAKASFAVEDAGTVDFAGFARLYGQLKAGQPVTNTDGEDVSGLRDLGEAFFEWQGGNLFYGPERIEPGAKDGFDYDAALIYGESYATKLAAIYERLRALEKKNDPDSKTEIRGLLGQMSALTKTVGVPKYDPSLWLPIDTPAKLAIHDELLPERTKTSKVGASIHFKVIQDAIRKYCAANAHDMLGYMGRIEDDATGADSTVSLFEAKRSMLYVKDLDGTKQEVPRPRKLPAVKAAMTQAMSAAFGL